MSLVAIKMPPGVARGSGDAMMRGRWWDTNLVRWRGQHMLPVGGWEKIGEPLPSKARRILSWRDLNDVPRTVYMCDCHIVIQEGSTYTDKTPADFTCDGEVDTTRGFGIGIFNAGTFGTPRTTSVNPALYLRASSWSADTFGQDLMMVASSDGRLLRYPPAGSVAAVTGAPTANRAMVVTEERHVMVFGASGNPRRVAWSSREDYTDWDFSSTTNTAGFFDLDTSGWIVNAVKVRGGVLIFTDSEVWLARYRGQPFIYGFERVGKACGLIAPQAFAATAGTAVWMGRQTFWVYDGGVVRPLACEIEDYVYDEMCGTARQIRPFAVTNGLFPEVWFFWPSKQQPECDRYVVWSFDADARWWGMGRLSRTAAQEAGVYQFPIMTGHDGTVYQHESGWLDAGLPRAGTIYAESGALSLPPAGERTMHVAQAQLDSQYGAQRVDLTAYTRFTRDGSEIAVGPYTPREDGYLDLRFAARDVRMRLTTRVDGDWTAGEMRFDLRQGGKR